MPVWFYQDANMLKKGSILFWSAVVLGAAYLFKPYKLMSNSNILVIGSSSVNDPNSFIDLLQDQHPQLSITKVASDGAQTAWMLNAAKSIIENNHFDAIFIWGGLNDIYATGSIQAAKENLQELYTLSKANSPLVVAITLQPTDFYTYYTNTKGALTNELNKWIIDNPLPNLVIDANSMLINSEGLQNTEYFSNDHLHLNTGGQLLICDNIDSLLF